MIWTWIRIITYDNLVMIWDFHFTHKTIADVVILNTSFTIFCTSFENEFKSVHISPNWFRVNHQFAMVMTVYIIKIWNWNLNVNRHKSAQTDSFLLCNEVLNFVLHCGEMWMRMYRDSENKQLHCTKLHLHKHKELTVTCIQ